MSRKFDVLFVLLPLIGMAYFVRPFLCLIKQVSVFSLWKERCPSGRCAETEPESKYHTLFLLSYLYIIRVQFTRISIKPCFAAELIRKIRATLNFVVLFYALKK